MAVHVAVPVPRRGDVDRVLRKHLPQLRAMAHPADERVAGVPALPRVVCVCLDQRARLPQVLPVVVLVLPQGGENGSSV